MCYISLNPAQRLAVSVVAALFTLWGGAKPDGGDRGEGDISPTITGAK